MSNQTFDGPQAAIVVYGLIFFMTLFAGLRRKLAVRSARWPGELAARPAPRFKLTQPGHAVRINLRRIDDGCFALDLRATDSPNFAVTEFPARTWAAALAQAKRMIPGLVVEVEPDASSTPTSPMGLDVTHSGHTAQLRFVGNRRFALDLCAAGGPDRSIAAFAEVFNNDSRWSTT